MREQEFSGTLDGKIGYTGIASVMKVLGSWHGSRATPSAVSMASGFHESEDFESGFLVMSFLRSMSSSTVFWCV